MPPMTPVQSSHILAVGWEDGLLYVQFSNYKTTVYGDESNPVPEDVANAVMTASSVGRALNDLVKSQGYPYRPAY